MSADTAVCATFPFSGSAKILIVIAWRSRCFSGRSASPQVSANSLYVFVSPGSRQAAMLYREMAFMLAILLCYSVVSVVCLRGGWGPCAGFALDKIHRREEEVMEFLRGIKNSVSC